MTICTLPGEQPGRSRGRNLEDVPGPSKVEPTAVGRSPAARGSFRQRGGLPHPGLRPRRRGSSPAHGRRKTLVDPRGRSDPACGKGNPAGESGKCFAGTVVDGHDSAHQDEHPSPASKWQGARAPPRRKRIGSARRTRRTGSELYGPPPIGVETGQTGGIAIEDGRQAGGWSPGRRSARPRWGNRKPTKRPGVRVGPAPEYRGWFTTFACADHGGRAYIDAGLRSATPGHNAPDRGVIRIISHVQIPAQVAQQVHDLRPVRSRPAAVVARPRFSTPAPGGESHRDHNALPHAAGGTRAVLVQPLQAGRDRTSPSALTGPVRAGRLGPMPRRVQEGLA